MALLSVTLSPSSSFPRGDAAEPKTLMLAQTHFPAPAAPFHYKDTELSASPSD